MNNLQKTIKNFTERTNEIFDPLRNMVKRTQEIFKPFQQSQEEFKKIITTVGSNSKQITKSTEKFVSFISRSIEEMSNGPYYEITSREYNRDYF